MSLGKVILVILATLVIFSTGLITGFILLKQIPQPPAAANLPMLPAQGLGWQQFLHRIQGELDLTPEQDQRISSILRDSQDRTRNLARAEMGKVREQIRSELTPPQIEKFERLFRERQRRMQEMRSFENRPLLRSNNASTLQRGTTN